MIRGFIGLFVLGVLSASAAAEMAPGDVYLALKNNQAALNLIQAYKIAYGVSDSQIRVSNISTYTTQRGEQVRYDNAGRDGITYENTCYVTTTTKVELLFQKKDGATQRIPLKDSVTSVIQNRSC